MGRKNNKAAAKKKEAAKAAAEQQQNEGDVKVSEVDQKSGNNANGQDDKTVAKKEEVPAEDPATMTPAARAQNYFDEQMKVYNKFVTDFDADIKMLNDEPDFSGKFGGIEKFKKEGTRKNNQFERR
jgi:hypothetical protein